MKPIQSLCRCNGNEVTVTSLINYVHLWSLLWRNVVFFDIYVLRADRKQFSLCALHINLPPEWGWVGVSLGDDMMNRCGDPSPSSPSNYSHMNIVHTNCRRVWKSGLWAGIGRWALHYGGGGGGRHGVVQPSKSVSICLWECFNGIDLGWACNCVCVWQRSFCTQHLDTSHSVLREVF
jgi:uncharacterized protein YbdZ (MbtH family)